MFKWFYAIFSLGASEILCRENKIKEYAGLKVVDQNNIADCLIIINI